MSNRYEDMRAELMRHLAEGEVRQPDRARAVSPKKQAEMLKERFELLIREDEFGVGDLVTWKDGLRNKTFPSYGMTAIVIQMLDEPIFAVSEPVGSAYFREPLNMLIGVLDPDEDLAVIHVDRRRFKRADI